MINVCFAGCGRISDLHALGYRDNKRARIYGLYDPDRKKAEQKAALWGAEKIFESYSEALADPAVDLVEILTPHNLHCSMACEAVRAGKHVSLQKPMALTLQEADQIVAAVDQSPLVFRVFENFVYYPPYVKAFELLRSGAIGEPLSFNLRVRCGYSPGAWDIPLEAWQWRFNPESGGGCPIMFDHNYHNFSLAIFMLGAVEKVVAWTGQTEIIEGSGLFVDVPASVMWKYSRGKTIGMMDVVMAPELVIESCHYADESRLEITGSSGIIFVNRCTGRLQNRPPLELYSRGITRAYEHIDCRWETSFMAATEDLVHALTEGGTPRLSAHEARDVLTLSLAVKKSAEKGEAATLPAQSGKR